MRHYKPWHFYYIGKPPKLEGYLRTGLFFTQDTTELCISKTHCGVAVWRRGNAWDLGPTFSKYPEEFLTPPALEILA